MHGWEAASPLKGDTCAFEPAYGTRTNDGHLVGVVGLGVAYNGVP